MKNKHRIKARSGLTEGQYNRLFYVEQDRRCALCTNQISLGDPNTCFDKQTQKFFCRRCLFSINALRRLGVLLDKAVEFVKGEKE